MKKEEKASRAVRAGKIKGRLLAAAACVLAITSVAFIPGTALAADPKEPLDVQLLNLLEPLSVAFDLSSFTPAPAGQDIDIGVGTYDVYLENIASAAAPVVSVQETVDGFSATITYPVVIGDVTAQRTCTFGGGGICIGPGTINGDFVVNDLVYSFDLTDDGCRLDIAPAGFSAELTVAAISIDGAFPALITWVAGYLDNTFLDDFETEMSYAVDTVIADISPEPIPNIKANGSDAPVTISAADTLSITVEMDPRCYPGVNVDWWYLAMTPFGWYHYEDASGTWTQGVEVGRQAALAEIAPASEILNMSHMPAGNYKFYFVVDGKMNGVLDSPSVHDLVDVEVTP